MAPPDRKPASKPPEKPWRQAVIGGVLVALGGALFGLGRKSDTAKKTPPPSPGSGQRGKTGQGVKAGPRRRRRENAKPQQQPGHAAKGAQRPRHSTEDGRPEHPVAVHAGSEKLGYEVKDTRVGILAIVMVVSVAIIAGSIIGLFSLIGHYRSVDARSGPLTPEQLSVIVPPGPHLQDHPLHDIAEERKRESDLLGQYAWTDPAHGRARIPIDRALALVVGKPLDPAPSPAPKP